LALKKNQKNCFGELGNTSGQHSRALLAKLRQASGSGSGSESGFHRSLRFAKVCQGSPRFAKVRQGSPRFTKVRQGSPRFAKVRQGSPRFAKVRQGSPSFAKLRQASPSFANHRQAKFCIGVEEKSKILLWRAGKNHFNEFEFDIFSLIQSDLFLQDV
jgi:hypothetical protein